MEEIDAGVDLVAVDRYAFHVHAERDMACVRAVQDAAQIVATYLDGARERISRPEDRPLSVRWHVHAQPAQESKRLLTPARRERQNDALRREARAPAVTQIVGEQPLRRRRLVDRLRDEVVATLDAFGKKPRRLAALGIVALRDDHAADDEVPGVGGDPDRAGKG